MARGIMRFLAFGSMSVVGSAVWAPVEGVSALDAVEAALHKIGNAPLSAEQKKLAMHAVDDVESVVTQLKSDTKLTKAQKMEKAKGAIQILQGLQSQWELAAVDDSLKKITDLQHLSPEQRSAAKKVVADVESTVHLVESGQLKGEARNTKVGLAVRELEGLQKEWFNTSVANRVGSLEKEIAAKKLLLKKAQAELKLADLEKELAEKKMQLKKFEAQKEQAEASAKESKEDAAQQEMVTKLVATAKALASQKSQAGNVQAVAKPTAVLAKEIASKGSPLSSIITSLKDREQKLSESIAHMDADVKEREAHVTKSIEMGEKAPKQGKTDATQRGQKMLQSLLKQEHRSYLKARALKESQRQELETGIRGIEHGDTAALTSLVGKMQAESKEMQGRAKNFLY